MINYILTNSLPGFTVGNTYTVVRKNHRFLSYNSLTRSVSTGYCVCRETYDDAKNLIQFTERPSAKWHRPMLSFSSFRPEVELLQAAPSSWTEKLVRYAEKYNFTFYPAQLREASKMLEKQASLVTAEVGCGKTLLSAVYLGLRTTRKSTTVIVAPKGVHPQWQAELSKFAGRRAIVVDDPGSLAAGINLINVEAFRSGASFNRFVDCVIADEAAFLASLSGQTTAFLAITNSVPLRLALTATPIPNRIEELFYTMGWLAGWTSANFPYAKEEQRRFVTDYCMSDEAIEVASGERIKRLLEPFLINLTKNECRSDLPPLKLRFVPCSTPESVMQSWAKCFTPGVPSNTETDFLNAGPRVFGKTAIAWEKIQHALAEGQQVLVVSLRIEALHQLRLLLESAGVCVSTISSESSSDYAESAEGFRTGKSRVMLMGLKCAQAYDFPNCHRVIILGSDFTYGMFHQALGRCHRLTSQFPISVEVLYYTGTNEAIKLNTVIAKAVQSATVLGERDYKLIGEISNDVRTVPDSEALAQLTNSKAAPIGA